MSDFDPAGDQAAAAKYGEAQESIINTGIDRGRKTAAYNALKSIYGDQAGDPDNWLKDTQAQANVEKQPFVAPQAAADVGQTTANTNYLNANTANAVETGKYIAPKSEADIAQSNAATGASQAQTATANAALPYVAPKAQAEIAASNAQTGQANASTNVLNTQAATAQGVQQRGAAAGLISTLSDTANKGGDMGAAFDQMAPQIAAMEGVDSAHLAPLRQMLIDDPTGTINKLQAGLQGINQQAIAGSGKANAATLQTPQEKAAAISVIRERTGNVPTQVLQAKALVPQFSGSATMRKINENIPGTAEYKFDQLMHSMKPNLALTDIQNMKATGLSLGRVTNMEMQAAGDAYANMDLGQQPDALVQNLDHINQVFSTVNGNLDQDIQRLGGGKQLTAPQARQSQAAAPSITADQATGWVKSAIPGATVTSTVRSPLHNKEVGGVPDSMHLNGQAVDFVLPKGTTFAQVQARLKQANLPTTELINEGDHVHWGWGPKGGGKQASAGATSYTYNPKTGQLE